MSAPSKEIPTTNLLQEADFYPRNLHDNLALHERILDGIADMIAVRGLDQRLLYANKAFCDFHGRTLEQLVGTLGPPLTATEVQEEQHILSTGNLLISPPVLRWRPGGASLEFTTAKSPIRDNNQQVTMVVSVSRTIFPTAEQPLSRLQKERDSNLPITGRHRQGNSSPRDIQERGEFYEKILDSITDMIAARGPDQRLLYVNKAFCDFHGQMREQLVGTLGVEMTTTELQNERHVISTGDLLTQPPTAWVRHDGVSLEFFTIKSPVLDNHRQVAMVVSVSRNFFPTANQVQTLLNEAHHKAVLRVIPDLVFRVNREGVYLDCSTPTGTETALPPALWLGKRIHDFLPELAPQFMEAIEQALDQGTMKTFDYSMFYRGAMTHWEARVVTSGENEVIAVVRDITLQKRAETSLKESVQQFRTLVEQSLVGICMIQQDRLVYANPKLGDMLGYSVEEITALRRPIKLVDKKDWPAVVKIGSLLDSQQSAHDETIQCILQGIRKDGRRIHVEVLATKSSFNSKPAIIATMLDVTARRQAEEARHHLQEELITTQQRMLLELSTPLIPINDHVVVMPIIGHLDAQRGSQMIERLLHGVSTRQTHVLILDVTGMPSVDTQTAGTLVRCAHAVRLLGVRMLLTGIGPDVAKTLVATGADLLDIITFGTLQAGIAYAVQLIKGLR